jgi:hypothetical protein
MRNKIGQLIMKEKPTFTFRLATPQYRRMLDFIAKDEGATPGKVLNKFIHGHCWDVMDKQASFNAHKELAISSGIPFDCVSWVRGAYPQDWQNLAQTIGEEKALGYLKRFRLLWEKALEKIDKSWELNFLSEKQRLGAKEL